MTEYRCDDYDEIMASGGAIGGTLKAKPTTKPSTKVVKREQAERADVEAED
ncbi:MAG TPA: hypothetical protein VFH56_04360 [Acidimicrobiales bacterium]|nr:hypothetical protein [Acidimicrobiales bacterium]